MAKKTKRQLYDEARELYCYTNMTLQEVADRLDLKVNTLYSYSTKENWVLLKESRIKEALKAKNIIISDRKLRSFKFYEDVMNKCCEMVKDSESFKEIKELTTTYILAEDRYYLLSKESLEDDDGKNKNKPNGILDDLAEL